MLEAITAHELAHCWRQVQGAWATLPSGFAEAKALITDDQDLVAIEREMREARREEGFADLVAMAWTLREHSRVYAEVHAWLARTRDDVTVPGEHHDTRIWVRLARDPTIFKQGQTPFEQAQGPWELGLFEPN